MKEHPAKRYFLTPEAKTARRHAQSEYRKRRRRGLPTTSVLTTTGYEGKVGLRTQVSQTQDLKERHSVLSRPRTTKTKSESKRERDWHVVVYGAGRKRGETVDWRREKREKERAQRNAKRVHAEVLRKAESQPKKVTSD
jgi:hypothetical protein